MPQELTTRARGCLVQGLEALDRHTEAPLRLLGHASRGEHEVFEMREEYEIGPCGRRFIVSVDRDRREAMLVPLGTAPRDAA